MEKYEAKLMNRLISVVEENTKLKVEKVKKESLSEVEDIRENWHSRYKEIKEDMSRLIKSPISQAPLMLKKYGEK